RVGFTELRPDGNRFDRGGHERVVRRKLEPDLDIATIETGAINDGFHSCAQIHWFEGTPLRRTPIGMGALANSANESGVGRRLRPDPNVELPNRALTRHEIRVVTPPQVDHGRYEHAA